MVLKPVVNHGINYQPQHISTGEFVNAGFLVAIKVGSLPFSGWSHPNPFPSLRLAMLAWATARLGRFSSMALRMVAKETKKRLQKLTSQVGIPLGIVSHDDFHGKMAYLPRWMVDFYGFHVGKYTIFPWILWGLRCLEVEGMERFNDGGWMWGE